MSACACRSSNGRALHCIRVCTRSGLGLLCNRLHLVRYADMCRGAGACDASGLLDGGVCRHRALRGVAHAWYPIKVGTGGSIDPSEAVSSVSDPG